MSNFMEGIGSFSRGAIGGLSQFADTTLSTLSPQRIGLIMLVLVLVIVVLIILLAIRGRRYDEAMDLIDQQVDAIVAAKRDAQATIDQKLQEQQRREEQMHDEFSQREQSSQQAVAEKERAFAEREDELHQLRQFKAQYGCIDDANAEVRRLIDEAQTYADDIKSRAEHEYTSIIGNAQSEAASIREMSQGIMARSHEAMKKALDRAKEIIEDAKRESELATPPRPAAAPAAPVAPDESAPPSDDD